MSAPGGAAPGILPVDKPAGPTSHDVVASVRDALRTKKVGHAGTLDPLATGLLVTLVGSATRLARFVEAGSKTYEARVVFGAATDTDDAAGAVIATAPVGDHLADPAYAVAAVAALVGEYEQVPPVYAAVKIEGRKAYESARRGETPELAARRVTVHRARLLGVETGPPVTWDVELDVSKGTYVRSIARDLGPAHGTVAYLGRLRRTRIGRLTVARAVRWEDLQVMPVEDVVARYADPIEALGLPAFALTPEEARCVANGATLDLPGDALVDAAIPVGWSVSLIAEDRLVAVYTRTAETLEPEVVLAESIRLGPEDAAGSSRLSRSADR